MQPLLTFLYLLLLSALPCSAQYDCKDNGIQIKLKGTTQKAANPDEVGFYKITPYTLAPVKRMETYQEGCEVTSFMVDVHYHSRNRAMFVVLGNDKIPKELRQKFRRAENVEKLHFTKMKIKCPACPDTLSAADIWMVVKRKNEHFN
jgi:hypothetical protein